MLLPSRDFPDDPDVHWDPERAGDVLLQHVEANGIKLVRVYALLSSRDVARLSAPFLRNHRAQGEAEIFPDCALFTCAPTSVLPSENPGLHEPMPRCAGTEQAFSC